MGQNPDTIRQQIAATRAEMDQTVEALGYKADVKSRAKENVQGKVDAVTGRVTSVKEKIVGTATQTGHGAKDQFGQTVGGAKSTIGDAQSSLGEGVDTAKQNVRQAASVAQENPIGLALGSIAIGVLAGMLIPSTRMENEKIGPMADQLKEQAMEAGQDVMQHGKEVAGEAMHAAQEAAQTAAQGAREAAHDAAQTVKDSGQQHAAEAKESVAR